MTDSSPPPHQHHHQPSIRSALPSSTPFFDHSTVVTPLAASLATPQAPLASSLAPLAAPFATSQAPFATPRSSAIAVETWRHGDPLRGVPFVSRESSAVIDDLHNLTSPDDHQIAAHFRRKKDDPSKGM